MPAMPASSEDAFLWAIGQQESGGNYKSVNSGSGALGKYQVMPSNVANWTKKALGHSLTPQQFLASPSAQESVARTILGGYYARYGAAGAAAMWYSGQPDPGKTYGNPPVYKYVASVLALMARAPGGAAAATVPPDTGGDTSSGTGSDPSAVQASSKPADCLVGFNLKVTYVCVLTYGQARALEGGLLLLAGGVLGAAGLIVLASFAVQKSGLTSKITEAAKVIPGAGALAAAAANDPPTSKTPASKNPPATTEDPSDQ